METSEIIQISKLKPGQLFYPIENHKQNKSVLYKATGQKRGLIGLVYKQNEDSSLPNYILPQNKNTPNLLVATVVLEKEPNIIGYMVHFTQDCQDYNEHTFKRTYEEAVNLFNELKALEESEGSFDEVYTDEEDNFYFAKKNKQGKIYITPVIEE